MADSTVVMDETAKKGQKRKREKQKLDVILTPEEREAKLKALNEELDSLCKYFNEVMSSDIGLSSHFLDVTMSTNGGGGGGGGNLNAVIALLLEEKSGAYSKVAAEVYERVKGSVTVASVKSSVLFVGQRVAYGVPKADADVLEDETGSCLWCWETRDMKLLPSSLRGVLKVRRTCRKKINERIISILDVISALQKPEDHPTYKQDVMKAADKLSKVLGEADIRLLVETLAQRNDSELAEKESKKKEIALIKELEKTKREAEKEKKRMDRELQKEKLQSEKEKKRLQQEAEKDEKRREKEESELRKQLKRKQEEAEREQRRKEKEEAELKKQKTVQKQASIMERFLKKSKTSVTPQNDQLPSSTPSDSDLQRSDSAREPVFLLMDSALQQKDSIDVKEIHKSHMKSWQQLGHSIRRNGKQHWGMRRKPKIALIKELKLTTNKGQTPDDDMCIDSIGDEWVQTRSDEKTCHANASAASPTTSKRLRRMQLLQFDKSNRPAFYGIWPKKSCVIVPRNPLKKDPDLDYDIDSDEEWEEEDPGESLSDSEKDEEENLDEGALKADDDEESEDGFFVPDGYLSENEGVETERNQSSAEAEVTQTTHSCNPESEIEEYSSWIRQLKYLHNLTEHSLRKNQPLIIINLTHEKAQLLSSEDLTGTPKAEQMCLQALSMRAFPGGISVEIPSDDNLQEENQEACTSYNRANSVATGAAATILESDLPKIVSVIQSCPQGISRVVESLQQTFPDIPKTHLKNKVREISDFVDNRWKVKTEVLQKLGMSVTPEKNRRRTKSIATFFSKRCLPPAGHVVNLCDSSPESSKPGSSSHQPRQQPQQQCTENM